MSRSPDAIDDLEIEVSRALNAATGPELRDALADERLPETARAALREGGVRLVALGEAYARMEIDKRFAPLLVEIAGQTKRIAQLERAVAALAGPTNK
jgi:hypothetical protein